MGEGLRNHALARGQGGQVGQVAARGGAAPVAGCDGSRQGAGGQVVENHGPGLGAALAKLRVAVSQQISEAEAGPGQVGGYINRQPHRGATGGLGGGDGDHQRISDKGAG